MNYKNKYLKYKLKYLAAKKIYGGMNDGSLTRDRSPRSSEYKEHERDRSPPRSEYKEHERYRSSSSSESDEDDDSNVSFNSSDFQNLSGLYKDEKLEESKKSEKKPKSLEEVYQQEKEYDINEAKKEILQIKNEIKELESLVEIEVDPDVYKELRKKLRDNIVLIQRLKNETLSGVSPTVVLNFKDEMPIIIIQDTLYSPIQTKVVKDNLKNIVEYAITYEKIVGKGSYKEVYKITNKQAINFLDSILKKENIKYVLSINTFENKTFSDTFIKNITILRNKINIQKDLDYIHLPYLLIHEELSLITIEEQMDSDLFGLLIDDYTYFDTVAKRCGVMLKLLKSINLLHSHNFLHLDIKSENFLVKKLENGDLQIKLTDFDFMEYKDSIPSLRLKGSKMFMDPMVLAYGRFYQDEYTFLNDLYSLGIIYYSLINQRYPNKKINFLNFIEDEFERNFSKIFSK